MNHIRQRALGILIALGVGACASVLGLTGPKRRPFAHRAHVVSGVSCTKCHESVAEKSYRDPVQLPGDASCLACHDQPHDARACLQCHGGAQRARVAQARHYLRFSHKAHLPQVKGQCTPCHSAEKGGATLLPTMADCLSCHAHRDDFVVRGCDRCHRNLSADGLRPADHVVHALDFSQRHGAQASAQADLCTSCHTQQQCAACHGVSVPALQAKLQFDRPTLAGLHRANFAARHALEASADPGLCLTCHSSSSCNDCHSKRGLLSGDLNPHPPGWVGLQRNDHGPAARRDPLGCASCHSGAKEQRCVDCHRVGGVGGEGGAPGWTSTKSARTDQPCIRCHVGP